MKTIAVAIKIYGKTPGNENGKNNDDWKIVQKKIEYE